MTDPERSPQQTSPLELILVLGVQIALSISRPVVQRQLENPFVWTNARVASVLAFEVGYGGLLVYYLHRRGWRLRDVSLPAEWKDVPRGVGVCLLGYLVCEVAALFAWVIFDARGVDHVGQVTLPLVVLAALINPFFEEATWLAYITHGPGRNRPALTAALSIGGRTLVHAYQGWTAIYFIAPLGAYFFYYYRRTQRLAPVVFAHGLMDLFGFIALRGLNQEYLDLSSAWMVNISAAYAPFAKTWKRALLVQVCVAFAWAVTRMMAEIDFHEEALPGIVYVMSMIALVVLAALARFLKLALFRIPALKRFEENLRTRFAAICNVNGVRTS
jgi:membrane protease YdiL (CAAX protease family)